MPKKVAAALLLLLSCSMARAQTFDTEFFPDDEWSLPQFYFPESDAVFITPAWGAPDPFRDFSKYRFGAVRYRERGLDDRHFRVMLGGVDLTDNLNSYPDWTLVTLVRRAGLSAERIPAMVPGDGQEGAGATAAGIAPAESYSLAPSGDPFYVSVRGADRYSRGRIDLRHSYLSPEWSHTLAVTAETGHDGHIAGVSSDAVGGVLSLSKRWDDGRGRGGSITFFSAANLSSRGVRAAATREAFSLTGDDLYNPNWGWQNGRVRNPRQNRTEQLFAALTLETALGRIRRLSITAAIRAGRSGRSRLAWYDALSPMPDYYRSMPSFFPDWGVVDVIADAWRAGDPSITQIDWDAIYYNNTLASDGRATYIVEDQVERTRDVHLNLNVDRRVGDALDISYGIALRRDRSRFFKEAVDMLGAQWVPNVDQYVTDQSSPDGEYHTSPPNENDLRDPGRRVQAGDRFGYDYAATRLVGSVFGALRWRGPRHGLTASGSLAHTDLRREGFYEKELFPGAASFGPSSPMRFTTYSLGMSAWWNPSGRHNLSVGAFAGSEAPYFSRVFLSPEQNNLAIPHPLPSGLYGAEVSWAFTGAAIDLRLTGFLNSTTGETMLRRYYDDLSSTFAEMVVRGVDRIGYGIEMGVEARLARWLTLKAGGSAGEFRYNSEPTATIYSDATGEVISENIVCYLSGLRTGVPQMVAGAELAYSDRRYWRVSLMCEWAGGRHVEINPLYHSSRVTGINSSPEIMSLFTSQERLPDAFTVGVSLSKGFVLGQGYLRIAAGVNNLLSAPIIHSGYEQMRIMRRGSGSERTLVPFPSKYTHGWPMTWNVTISYRL